MVLFRFELQVAPCHFSPAELPVRLESESHRVTSLCSAAAAVTANGWQAACGSVTGLRGTPGTLTSQHQYVLGNPDSGSAFAGCEIRIPRNVLCYLATPRLPACQVAFSSLSRLAPSQMHASFLPGPSCFACNGLHTAVSVRSVTAAHREASPTAWTTAECY